MPNSLRHLNALRAFEAAARLGSFAKAGADLNVSHSVVSQHIRNLEQWFGNELFKRHGNRVELTDDGRTLQPQLANAFRILEDACDGMLRTSQKGTLIISAEPALASLWLRKHITEFCKQYPKIDIDIRPAWQPPRMGQDHADMIVHFETRMPQAGAERMRLFPIDGFPACSPDLKARIETQSDNLKWQGAPLVHDNGREIWHQWFATHEPKSGAWQEGRIYSNLSLAIDAAVDGEGVILADEVLCQKELESGLLVKCDPRQIRCVWYSVAVPRNTSDTSALATLTAWLLDVASSEVALSDGNEPSI